MIYRLNTSHTFYDKKIFYFKPFKILKDIISEKMFLLEFQVNSIAEK